MEFFSSKIERLIETSNNAASSSRYAFLIWNFTALIFLITYFNNRWSWLRFYELRPNEYLKFDYYDGKETILFDSKVEIKKFLGYNAQFVHVPVINIDIHYDDIDIIYTSWFIIIAVWLAFCLRRERIILSTCLHVINDERLGNRDNFQFKEFVGYLYYGIVFGSIFNTSTKQDSYSKKHHQFEKNSLIRNLLFVIAFAPISTLTIISIHEFYIVYFKVNENLIIENNQYSIFSYVSCNAFSDVPNSSDYYSQFIEIIVRTISSSFLLVIGWKLTLYILSLNKEINRIFSFMNKIEKGETEFEEEYAKISNLTI